MKDPRDAPTAGMLAALFISLGLVSGAAFSFVPKAVVVNLGSAFGLAPIDPLPIGYVSNSTAFDLFAFNASTPIVSANLSTAASPF